MTKLEQEIRVAAFEWLIARVPRLKNLWGTELRKKGTPPQKKTTGRLVFHQCTLWWDGKETALVCTEYSYSFDDKSLGDGGGGSSVGMAALVTRHNGKWQVTDSRGTLAAG